MKAPKYEYTCDLCGMKKNVDGDHLPQNWTHVRRCVYGGHMKEVDVCSDCINEITENLTLDQAKKLVVRKTPVTAREHPTSCNCQACNPD